MARRRRRRLHGRYNRNAPERAPRSNPPLWTDVAEFVLPGFGGFAATRMLTRFATVQIAKRKPSWAKHAGALASIASFAAAYWGANRVKLLERYQMPLVVGAGLAALQSLIQLYIPKVGWLLDAGPDASDATVQRMLPASTQQQILDYGLELVNENPSDFVYDDRFDPGRFAKQAGTPPPATQAAAKVVKEEAILADLGLADDDIGNLGSLAAN